LKRRLVTFTLALMMIVSIFSLNAFAAAPAIGDEIQTVVVDLADVLVPLSSSSRAYTRVQHAGHRAGTGPVQSPPETLDLSGVIPNNREIVSITVHVPSNIRVTRSQFTAIQNFEITHQNGRVATIPFTHTDNPGANSRSIAFAGLNAGVRYTLRITGSVLSNTTGLDGFTVFPGARLIVEFR